MEITVVWDTWLKSGAEDQGLRLTRQVRADMRASLKFIATNRSKWRREEEF